jgi:Flp pilus assembly pilin Flp
MAALQNNKFLGNSRGQSAVEYILLLAVIASLTFGVLKNKKFKDFMNGKSGLFVALKDGMEYSFRYGRELNSDIDSDQAANFSYQTNKHDLYYNPTANQSHFFSGADKYGSE